jgi:hypothetical protein
MANKKLGKLLAFTAITGAAIAAGIAYFKHKNNSEFFDDDLDDLDDDFDDEDFDFPLPTETDENTVKREYVSLNLDKESADKEDSSEQIEEEKTEVLESQEDEQSTKESDDVVHFN